MWIERDWGPSVAALARTFPVLLLTGPRQVGKTSLLRHQYPKATYVTFDDIGRARQAEESPADFFANLGREPVILDEIQYVPSLFRHLKALVDERPQPKRFLLTGSQTFPLMQGVSESLAGRCGILEMSSLSIGELRRAFPDRSEAAILIQGGFPALHAGPVERPADWYSSYLATYLERDVRNLRNVGSLRDFDRFLRALALRSGQLLSFSDLARDVGIAPNTARSWVSVLEASGQVFLLEPYHRSLGKRLVKSPKVYFMDTGLACHLVGIADLDTWLASPLAGPLWETFVVGQVVRHYRVERSRPPLWFWRTGSGDEVDLLVEQGGRFIAVECKLAGHPGDDSLRGFTALEAFYGAGTIERAYVACRTSHAYRLGRTPGATAVSAFGLIEALAK